MAIEPVHIVDEALMLINEVGLDAFTTRKLAERLGVQQPALYWHFRNKSALLDGLNEAMLDRYHTHRLPSPGENWDDFLLANARSFRRALRRVRNGGRLNSGTRPSARQLADTERQLALYVEAGFSPEQALAMSIGVARYVTGFVIEEQDERDRQDESSDADPAAAIQPFPLLTEALTPLLVVGAINTDAVFEAGLGFMVAGIRASLKKPRKKARGGEDAS